jgi:hypothetical protein
MKGFYCLMFYVLCLCSCSTSEYLTPDELAVFVRQKEHGLCKVVEKGGVKLEVIYRPTDLLVGQELENPIDTTAINRLRKKYSSHYYFILSLSKDNKEALHQTENLETYSDLVETMSFRMPEYVSLTTSNSDTIAVSDFMLNRTFGMSASTDILFAFDKEKSKNKEWVQFNLDEIGLGAGDQTFRFRVKDLENVPQIYRTHN